jgi:hypothetical protein
MNNPKNNNNQWDNQGKGKESIDSNERTNSRANEGGRPPKYSSNDTSNKIAKTLNGMKARVKK